MLFRLLLLLSCVLALDPLTAADAPFVARVLRESTNVSDAVLRIDASRRSPYPIPAFLTGKFAEHLYYNIVNGMDAQILRNPTFADFPISTGGTTPDGVVKFQVEDQTIGNELRRIATEFGCPSTELDSMVEARADGLAALWVRVGARAQVSVSPDTGPNGGRAQRVRVAEAGLGIAQWAYLPLHRVRTYEVEIFARAPEPIQLTVSLSDVPRATSEGTASIGPISNEWKRYTATTLRLPEGVAADRPCCLKLVSDSPGQFVIRHILLRPTDHVNGADPDVIRFLKESHLPLLRWPGGNFVSGYHWEDGIGPIKKRPTRPNYAWGQPEPNLFGTDEFIAFCRAVGCEPMICVNAGDGTPAEAARWVEYCNGSPTSPMGAVRAANGHPEPYGINHWEVGNELWGRWQVNWTLADGYVDRYQQFSKAMRAADAAIELQACGAPVFWGKQWNTTLIQGVAPGFQTITDHPLIGGNVTASTDPLDVYRDFMAVPEVLEQKWSALRDEMQAAGIKEPRLAVTELQLFAHLRGEASGERRLTRDNLVSPPTLAEGLYDVLIYHAAVRLAPFVEMVTQSAVVNHGGGLRKTHERVFANPCHYAQAAFAALAGSTPVASEIEAASEPAPLVLPELKNVTSGVRFAAVDAIAALSKDGDLLVSLIHRGSSGPIRLRIDVAGFQPGERATLHTLVADVPWAVNRLDAPDAVKPNGTTVQAEAGGFEIGLKPYSVSTLKIPHR